MIDYINKVCLKTVAVGFMNKETIPKGKALIQSKELAGVKIKVYFIPDQEDPERPCWPREIVNELLNTGRLPFFLRAMTEEAQPGGPEGDCHDVAASIMEDLVWANCAEGWTWVEGYNRLKPDKSKWVHSWLECEGWAIDASHHVTMNIGLGERTILVMDASLYRKTLQIKITKKRDSTQTKQYIIQGAQKL